MRLLLQTYSTAKGRIDYFVVLAADDDEKGAAHIGGVSITDPEEDLFGRLEQDAKAAALDLDGKAGIFQVTDGSRWERIPWLSHTGFPTHLQGLRDREIRSSYALPPKRVLDGHVSNAGSGGGGGGDCDVDADLVRLLNAAEGMLRDAYKLCCDRPPARKMTQQRARILNEFYSGATGKAQGFRSFKNASTRASYFRKMKELLAYHYRVAYRADRHFTRESDDQVLPGDVIELTRAQQRAMEKIMGILQRDGVDSEEVQAQLRHAVRQLYVAMICHVVGSVPFRSSVLSFCAMLSRAAAQAIQAQKASEALQQQVTLTQREAAMYTSLLAADHELFVFWSSALAKRTRRASSSSSARSTAKATTNFREHAFVKSLSELNALLAQILTAPYDDTRHARVMATEVLRSLFDSDFVDTMINTSFSSSKSVRVRPRTLAIYPTLAYGKCSDGERKDETERDGAGCRWTEDWCSGWGLRRPRMIARSFATGKGYAVRDGSGNKVATSSPGRGW
ncbi:hypothetical protein V8C42DRAFT_362771 [Trichoderma barbatum]